MREIVAGVHTWSVHNEERGIDFNGWYVNRNGQAAVIDPPPAGEEVLAKIEQLGRPNVIVLTNAHHTRAAEQFRERFDCPIYIHQNDRVLLSVRAQGVFRNGSKLACGLLAITLRDGKTPGESALFLDGDPACMFVGDACVTDGAGELKMLPPEKFRDPQAAKAALRVLLDFEFDALLLGDGVPIVAGGKQRLEAFCAPQKNPWDDIELDDDEPVPGRGHGWMEVEEADIHMPPPEA